MAGVTMFLHEGHSSSFTYRKERKGVENMQWRGNTSTVTVLHLYVLSLELPETIKLIVLTKNKKKNI